MYAKVWWITAISTILSGASHNTTWQFLTTDICDTSCLLSGLKQYAGLHILSEPLQVLVIKYPRCIMSSSSLLSTTTLYHHDALPYKGTRTQPHSIDVVYICEAYVWFACQCICIEDIKRKFETYLSFCFVCLLTWWRGEDLYQVRLFLAVLVHYRYNK